MIKYISSRYYIKPSVFYWVVAFLFILKLFIINLFSSDFKIIVEYFIAFAFAISYPIVLFYISFNSYNIDNLKDEIQKLKLKIEDKYSSVEEVSRGKQSLLGLELIVYVFSDKLYYVHICKSKEQLVAKANINNYIIVLLILFIGQSSFINLGVFGHIAYLTFILVAIVFCIRIILWQALELKKLFSQISFVHLFILYLLFVWGKYAYVDNYGDEILNSYLEKPSYKTKYYVNVFGQNDSVINYRLPADIYVYSENSDSPPTEDYFGRERIESYTTRHISLIGLHLPDGKYLRFNDCDLEIEKKVYCQAQNGDQWIIELTNKKVR